MGFYSEKFYERNGVFSARGGSAGKGCGGRDGSVCLDKENEEGKGDTSLFSKFCFMRPMSLYIYVY